MEIQIIDYRGKTIEEFADEHGLVMRVGIRREAGVDEYFAYFLNTAIYESEHVICSPSGRGKTQEEAIKDYASQIEFKKMQIGGEKLKIVRVPAIEGI